MGKCFLVKSVIHLRPMFWTYRKQATDFQSKSIDGNIASKWYKRTDGTFWQESFQNKIKFLNNWKLHIFFQSKFLFLENCLKMYLTPVTEHLSITVIDITWSFP